MVFLSFFFFFCDPCKKGPNLPYWFSTIPFLPTSKPIITHKMLQEDFLHSSFQFYAATNNKPIGILLHMLLNTCVFRPLWIKCHPVVQCGTHTKNAITKVWFAFINAFQMSTNKPSIFSEVLNAHWSLSLFDVAQVPPCTN